MDDREVFVEEHEDYIIIGPRKDIKARIIAIFVLSPFCMIDWIGEWLGIANGEPKVASYALMYLFVVVLAGTIIDGNTRYVIDNGGVTRIIFKK